MRQEFAAHQINLSTDYRVPRQWTPGTHRTIHVNGAHALDDLLDDGRIRRELPTSAVVELTQLTLDAEDPATGRHIHVEATRHGATALIEGDNRDWVNGRSEEIRHAVEDGHHPSGPCGGSPAAAATSGPASPSTSSPPASPGSSQALRS
ncbi:hypothetical protein ACWDQL_34230 [Streptomyces olivaceus]